MLMLAGPAGATGLTAAAATHCVYGSKGTFYRATGGVRADFSHATYPSSSEPIAGASSTPHGNPRIG